MAEELRKVEGRDTGDGPVSTTPGRDPLTGRRRDDRGVGEDTDGWVGDVVGFVRKALRTDDVDPFLRRRPWVGGGTPLE